MKTHTHNVEVSRGQFETIVATSFSLLPQWVKDTVKNVAVVAEDVVPEYLVEEMDLRSNLELLGLYSGIPLARRDHDSMMFSPDIVTLFRLPCIMEAKETGSSIEDVVYETMWHEIGHHFGLDEEGVVKKEKKGNNKKPGSRL